MDETSGDADFNLIQKLVCVFDALLLAYLFRPFVFLGMEDVVMHVFILAAVI